MDLSWDIFKEYLPQVYITLGALVLLWLLKFVIRKTAKKVGAMMGKPRERIRYIRKVIGGILNVTFIICIALYWGVKPQNLAIAISSVLAFVGVAMFAQWSMVSSLTAGVIMFFSAPFHVGNSIRIIDKDFLLEATIEHIGAFYTHLRTPEGELVIIPNNLFLQKVVGIK
jgi:small-conductance mechanosensitive channel